MGTWRWIKGEVIGILGERSYKLETEDGGHIIRNRRNIRPI